MLLWWNRVCRCPAGVLILSEFAGAAQSLGAGAILVNPWNINDMAAAIKAALTMRCGSRCAPGLQDWVQNVGRQRRGLLDPPDPHPGGDSVQAGLSLRAGATGMSMALKKPGPGQHWVLLIITSRISPR